MEIQNDVIYTIKGSELRELAKLLADEILTDLNEKNLFVGRDNRLVSILGDINPRIYKICREQSLHTIQDILDVGRVMFERYRNCGKRSLNELSEALAKIGHNTFQRALNLFLIII